MLAEVAAALIQIEGEKYHQAGEAGAEPPVSLEFSADLGPKLAAYGGDDAAAKCLAVIMEWFSAKYQLGLRMNGSDGSYAAGVEVGKADEAARQLFESWTLQLLTLQLPDQPIPEQRQGK